MISMNTYRKMKSLKNIVDALIELVKIFGFLFLLKYYFRRSLQILFSMLYKRFLNHISLFPFKLINRLVLTMSFLGNNGTKLTSSYRKLITDKQFIIHILFLVISSLGFVGHEFCYSLLVSEIIDYF